MEFRIRKSRPLYKIGQQATKDNKFRVMAVGVILAAALVIFLLVQISPKIAFAFAALAILSPILGMMYFFNRLGK